MGGLLTSQPGKTLYALLATVFELARFPLWIILYYPKFTRPHPQWTYAQAIRMRCLKAFLKHSSVVEVKTPPSLAPGKEKERFVILKPATDSSYVGPASDDTIKPATIGSTWSPAPLTSHNAKDADVVLHFHGGAYVIGSGRDDDTGFLAKTMLRHARVSHVFTPQYRLSSNPGGRFPAALQDAITAYAHLVHALGVPAARITVSGDSAGGNLTLALLRYIAEHGAAVGLPWPGCVWLWSPWVDVGAAFDKSNMDRSPQFATDYLSATFGLWGARAFCEHLDPKNPFISHLGRPFASRSPIWIQTGRVEVLYEDDKKLAEELQAVEGNRVELLVKQNVPHDIILVGAFAGFAKEAGECAKVAGEFLRANRLESS